jgi:hypothetical protein
MMRKILISLTLFSLLSGIAIPATASGYEAVCDFNNCRLEMTDRGCQAIVNLASWNNVNDPTQDYSEMWLRTFGLCTLEYMWQSLRSLNDKILYIDSNRGYSSYDGVHCFYKDPGGKCELEVLLDWSNDMVIPNAIRVGSKYCGPR